jgi:predicted DNA-binding transcriptional regulator AlpA
MESLVVDTQGAATRIGLSAATLEKKRVYGDGPPFIKMGRSVRYRLSDLEAWIAARVVNSTSERSRA